MSLPPMEGCEWWSRDIRGHVAFLHHQCPVEFTTYVIFWPIQLPFSVIHMQAFKRQHFPKSLGCQGVLASI